MLQRTTWTRSKLIGFFGTVLVLTLFLNLATSKIPLKLPDEIQSAHIVLTNEDEGTHEEYHYESDAALSSLLKDVMGAFQLTFVRNGPSSTRYDLYKITLTYMDGSTHTFTQYKTQSFCTPDGKWYEFTQNQGDLIPAFIAANPSEA